METGGGSPDFDLESTDALGLYILKERGTGMKPLI